MKPSDSQRRHREQPRRRQPRAARFAIAVVVTALLVAGLSGCGNWITVHDAGEMGLTVDAAGQPVVAILTCSKSTPVITMSEGRKKSDPGSKVNVSRGQWEARRAFAGLAKLALTAPGETWKTIRVPGQIESDRLFIVDGGTLEDKNASLGGVNFRTGELATLSPDQVKVNGKIKPLSAFAAYKCRKD